MITVNGQQINVNFNYYWTVNGNNLSSSQGNTLCTIESDVFSLVLPDPQDKLFFTFEIDGNIPNLSTLNFQLIFHNVGIVNWVIRKRILNSGNMRAVGIHKFRIRKAWFNNQNQNASLRITFQSGNNTGLNLYNLDINSIPNINTQSNVVFEVSARTGNNSTGTSGPNGPR